MVAPTGFEKELRGPSKSLPVPKKPVDTGFPLERHVNQYRPKLRDLTRTVRFPLDEPEVVSTVRDSDLAPIAPTQPSPHRGQRFSQDES